jgi:hypothetical protein
MDFDDDLRREITKYLPHDEREGAALSTARTSELLITFLNWLGRYVHPHPRKVLRSRELSITPLLTQNRADLEAIACKLSVGVNIAPHLSKGILKGYTPTSELPKNLHKKKDLDLLLNEWGIHHLHVSNVVQANGFVKRGSVLLFVIFSQANAYLLDLSPHGVWTEQRLVEIAVRNWPGDGLFVELKGIVPEVDISSKDRENFRRVGIATTVNIDGNAYTSRTGGLTLGGTSGRVTMEAARLHKRIKEVEAECRDSLNSVKRYFQKASGPWPAKPEFHLELISTQTGFQLAVREQGSGALLLV